MGVLPVSVMLFQSARLESFIQFLHLLLSHAPALDVGIPGPLNVGVAWEGEGGNCVTGLVLVMVKKMEKKKQMVRYVFQLKETGMASPTHNHSPRFKSQTHVI